MLFQLNAVSPSSGRLHSFCNNERVRICIDPRYEMANAFQHLHNKIGIVQQVYVDHPVIWVRVGDKEVLAEACILRKV